VIGLGLILIFGRSGVVNQLADSLFGLQLGRWIYGFNGVWLAQVFSFTPTAFLVLIGVVEGISPAMEEASSTLRASRMRTFRAVSLPLMLPGIANAWLVVFIESLADFGNPIVLGGSFGVLSTEIFFAVVGAQQDFGRAAVLAGIMLVIALCAFTIQRVVIGARSYVSLTGKGDVGLPTPLPAPVRRLAYAIALPWALLTIIVYTMALAGGFVRVWGRDWTPTLSHFKRAFALEWSASGALILSGGAWHSLFTTIKLAAIGPCAHRIIAGPREECIGASTRQDGIITAPTLDIIIAKARANIIVLLTAIDLFNLISGDDRVRVIGCPVNNGNILKMLNRIGSRASIICNQRDVAG
jgi:iron(III) transport system permease protein